MSNYTRIKLRRAAASSWTSTNPTLLAGELGVDTTNNKVKIGTGSATWTALPYATLTPTEINSLITGLQGQIDALSTNLSNTLDDYVPIGDVAQADGVASLDSSGKVPASQLPAGLATTTDVSTAISNLVASSPSTLNTLNELAAALNNDANFAGTVTTSLGNKAPIASPALTGTPTAPTPAAGDSTTKIATTEYVQGSLGMVMALAL
jgi:hypothetical protein